jgi:hypothetical protein
LDHLAVSGAMLQLVNDNAGVDYKSVADALKETSTSCCVEIALELCYICAKDCVQVGLH